MAGYLGNPKLIVMTQDNIPVANFEYPVNPTASVNPIRVPVTWLNTVTGCRFICTDNTTDANVWKLMSGFRGALIKKGASLGNQVLSTGVSAQITFNEALYDTDAFFDDTSQTKFIIPQGVHAVRVSGGIFYASGSNRRDLRIQKNNANLSGLPFLSLESASMAVLLSTSSSVIYVDEGDFFTLVGYQTSGGPLNVMADDLTWFSIEVIE